MRSKLLKPSFPVSRSIALVLIVAVVAASGCRWFRKDKDVYAQSPESRPLEVPPDLDMPNTEGAMKMPSADEIGRASCRERVFVGV